MSYIYMEHPFLMFLDHTQRGSTVGRTPLDEWSARRKDFYLATHDTHNRQISMPPVGFEPKISAGERPQTYALDRTAIGTGHIDIGVRNILWITVNCSFDGTNESVFGHNFGISYNYLNGWVIVSVISEWVSEWVRDWVSKWVSECVTEWASEWVSEWLSECVTEWASEWVREWVSKWVSEWVTEWRQWYSKRAMWTVDT